MKNPNEMFWFKEYPATEYSDIGKEGWDAEQWGWYSLLKIRSWISDPKGKLPKKQSVLISIAKANPQAEKFKERWAAVLKVFKVEGDQLVLPYLAAQAREEKAESTEKSRSGKIPHLRKRFFALADTDPEKEIVRAELVKLYEKTAGGVPEQFKRGATSTVPPPAKKSARTRGLQEGGGKPPPVLEQHENGTKTPDGRIWHNGEALYRSQLDKLKAELVKEIASLTVDIDAAREPRKSELRQQRASLRAQLDELKISLGLRTRSKFSPEASPNMSYIPYNCPSKP